TEPQNSNSEWECRISRSRKMVYYYNRATKESTWELPPGVDPNTIKGYGEKVEQRVQAVDPLSGTEQIRA
ncbi:30385_t:CDS:1, partial [Racocetra persica]